MSDLSQFHHIVNEIMRSMGVDQRSFTEAGEVYTFTVNDEIEINMIGVQENAISLLARVGNILNRSDPATLLTLLSCNQFDFADLAIHVGIDPGSRDVVLWSRQVLAGLDGPTAIRQLRQFMDNAIALQDWLNAPPASAALPTMEIPGYTLVP
jgi:hypothetical protein